MIPRYTDTRITPCGQFDTYRVCLKAKRPRHRVFGTLSAARGLAVWATRNRPPHDESADNGLDRHHDKREHNAIIALLHFIRLLSSSSIKTDRRLHALLFSVVLHLIGTTILLQCGGTQQASISAGAGGGGGASQRATHHTNHTYIIRSMIVCHKYLTTCGYRVPFP